MESVNDIRLFEKSNIDELIWPKTKEATFACEYLLPLVEKGVSHFIKNVDTKLYLLKISDKIIPITVNEKEYDNAYIVSNYFPIRHWHEKLAQEGLIKKLIQEPVRKIAGLLCRVIKINKIVMVNNWLFPTNIYPALSRSQITAMTSFLQERFPDHLLIMRGVNTHDSSELIQHLGESSYRLLKTRDVYIYDPAKKRSLSSKVHYHHRRDRRLVEKHGYKVLTQEDFSPSDIPRLLELYKGIYVERYTCYSPHYSEAFLSHVMQHNLLQLIGIQKEGQIDGIIGCFEKEKRMIAPFFGYERNKASTSELYRLLTMLIIDEAEKKDLVLNDSSGSARPKKYRGLKAHLEYTAVFAKHLPPFRRLVWALSEKMMNNIFYPRMKQ